MQGEEGQMRCHDTVALWELSVEWTAMCDTCSTSQKVGQRLRSGRESLLMIVSLDGEEGQLQRHLRVSRVLQKRLP